MISSRTPRNLTQGGFMMLRKYDLRITSILIGMWIAGIGLAGCGSSKPPGQSVGDYIISFQISPDPPAVGTNMFTVNLTDASGSPVTGATVKIRYSMPAMAGMPAMGDEVQARRTGDGEYKAEIDLGAGGKFPWDVTIQVIKDQTTLVTSQWQITPGTKGVKFVSAEGAGTTRPAQTKSSSVQTVNVPLYQQQLIGVQRDTVRLMATAKTIRTIGHVAYAETQVAAINLKFSGWIEKLYADYTGKFVRKGEPLFDIYSPELVSTQEELLQSLHGALGAASNGSERRNSLRQSVRNRLLLWGISEEQIEEIAREGAPKLTLTFYSPITGYVLEKNALQGRYAKAGTDLYTIADLSTVWVHADIYEHELSLIRVGQKAVIRLPYDPSAEYRGKVDYVYPTLQNRTRTARIRLVFPNPDLKLKPDMYADVEIEADQGEGLAIPASAVLNTGLRQIVFVDRGNGRFEPRAIKLGPKAGRYYVVLEGLKEGEVIVKSGNFLIDAEAHVQGVLETM
jgi:Cu(I)/Ag(I) efflux system membrane fusion protein